MLTNKGLEVAVYNTEDKLHVVYQSYNQERLDYNKNKLINHFPQTFTIRTYKDGLCLFTAKGKGKY